ncbi:CxxxxCH/CxxCH domain c-type cytochrome [Geobacter grbiciae]|uniref:CxxxxCH/CxxCH domain c-type cytochrome n=1 Tax=Geobacter grbiciae TaxID=155042 RepID=UPI001C039246|nr:CxxxxCH/CxxCH domain-containing protein [Geobacter grbiciae]MBT1075384.1 CxxxxCH/CxxCH domain-containing protein [Geobacter grbiciae]
MKPILVATAAMISVMLLTVTGAGAAMQCYDCHGTSATMDYRPVDASYRNISTGGFKGNHQTHMGSGASSTDCAVCHGGGATSYLNSHRSGNVDIAANINNSPATGTYSRGTSFAQSTTPTLGTCSSVNCHFEAATPTWGADPSLTTCSTCHGAAPADGSHPATSGSGKKHGDYYGLTTSSCVKCHPDHTAEAKPFAHATSAGNRALIVAFNAAPNNGFGRYTGNTNYPNYLPSQSPSRNGTCKNLYCHSNGSRGFAPYTSNNAATWGGSLTCKGCHKGSMATNGDPMVTGSHLSHVFGTSGFGAILACTKCHAATAGNGMAIIDTSKHVDKLVTIAFNNTSSAASGSYNGTLASPASPMTKAPGSSYATCSTVYCHSSGQGDGGTWPPTYTTPKWGDYASGQCGTCHGINTKHGIGAGFNIGTPTPLTSGSHTKHLSYTMGITAAEKCAECHVYTRTGFSPGACGSASCHDGTLAQKHPNYAVNVGIPDYYGATATYNAASLTPGTGYSSCSNVYCHSNGLTTAPTYYAPTWGTVADGACGTCHGVTAAAPPASVPHVKHMGIANQYRFACAECHSGKVQVTANSTVAPTFTNLTSHVNKSRDVKFDPTNPFGTYSTASLSCRNLYCHSTGNTGVASGNLPGVYGGKVYARVTWSGSVTCTSCHGRSTANGMPDYANAGTPGSDTVNSHSKHVTSSNIQCVECHEKTTKNNTSIRAITPSYHVNATSHDVFFNLSGLSPSGTYDSALKKCSSTYCHGAGASVAWGGTTYCNSCHSANDGASGGGGINNWSAGVSAHTLHVEDTTTLPSKYTNYSTGNLGSAAAYRFACASCHNPASTIHLSGYASGSYRAQVFFGYTAPGKKPAYTYTGTAGTADNGFGWSSGNTVCNQTYCHSNGVGGTGAAVSWATTANTAGVGRCQKCHGNATYTADYRGGAPLYASGSISYRGASKGNAHQLHIDAGSGAAAASDPQCLHCHAGTTTTNTSITNKVNHIDKGYDVTAGGTFADGDNIGGAAISVTTSYTYNASGSSCSNVSCHPTGLSGAKSTDVVSWNDKQTCDDCHKVNLNNNTGYHHAMRNYSGSSASYPKAIPGATAGANDVNRRCTMCHVDHGTFSPNLNASNTTYGSAGNLRMSIYSSVTATKGYSNRDFFKTGSGGICVSCHNSELFKDTGNVRVKSEANSTKTAAIVLNNYTGSAHEYAISSVMKRDSKVFYSDCTKCHNGRRNEVAVFSGMTTAVHDRDVRRIYASLGTNQTDGIDALFCYRCHSNATDAIGGTKKPTANKDYYATAAMTAASQDIWTVFSGVGSTTYTTTASSTLYLRDTGAINAVPPATEPTAYQYSSGTYATNTFTQEDMAPTSGTINATTVISTGNTAARYDRGIQFISPQIDNTVTIASGSTFTLTIREYRSFGTTSDYTRFTVYKWDGATATPLNANAAPNNFVQDTVAIPTTATNNALAFTTNSAVTLNPGDALICEVEFYHSSGTTALNVTYAYGNYGTDAAALALPAGTYNWRTTATTSRFGHGVENAAYAGKHKPSPTDETFTYLSANKHISCNDCHDPHEARSGNHTAGGTTLPKVLKGATGVTTPAWPALWTAPAQSAYGTAPVNATAEWQICFKCHSGANSNVTTWGGSGSKAFTDLGLEFNPNNESYHPVIQALPSTGNRRLASGALTGGWTPGSVMTCSDCHATDSASSKGPHGSTVKWMLNPNTTGTKYYNWPYTSAANNGTNGTTGFVMGTGSTTVPTNNFCFSCHVWSAGGAAHTQRTGDHAVACVQCHIRVPHGGKVLRLLTGPNAPLRYYPDGQSNALNVGINGGVRPSSGTITESGCTTAGVCGTQHSGAGQKW